MPTTPTVTTSELEPHTGRYDWAEAMRQGQEHFGLEPYDVPDEIRDRIY